MSNVTGGNGGNGGRKEEGKEMNEKRKIDLKIIQLIPMERE